MPLNHMWCINPWNIKGSSWSIPLRFPFWLHKYFFVFYIIHAYWNDAGNFYFLISAINNMSADDLATLRAKETAAPLFTSFDNDYYIDNIMGAMTSQMASLTIVCSAVDSGADQRKYLFFLFDIRCSRNKVTDTLSEPTTAQIPRCINNFEQMRYFWGGKIAVRSLLGLIDVVRYQDKLNDGARVNCLVIKYEYDSVPASIDTSTVPSNNI